MTSDRPRTWRVHIGVHKTATTHLQRTLELRRNALREQGLDYVPVSDLRARGFSKTLRKCVGASGLRGLIGRARIRQDLRQIVSDIRGLGDDLLISEENIIGNAGKILNNPLYSGEHLKIACFMDLIPPQDSVRLFVAIRCLDTLAPSAYAQSLRLKRPEFAFSDIRESILASTPSWFEFVVRIMAAAPRATLTAWRYEDYRRNRDAITRRVCGVDPGPLPDLPVPQQTRTPGRDAIAAAESLPRTLAGDAWRAEVARIFAESDATVPAFAPFSGAEISHLQLAYQTDIERISELPSVDVMAFPHVATCG